MNFALLKNLRMNGWSASSEPGAASQPAALPRAHLLEEARARTLGYLQLRRAKKALGQWLSWVTRSRLKPFVKLAQTLTRYDDEILAYIPGRQENGLTDGLNEEIRIITRRAYGLNVAAALEARIHRCCGGITLDPPLPSPSPTP